MSPAYEGTIRAQVVPVTSARQSARTSSHRRALIFRTLAVVVTAILCVLTSACRSAGTDGTDTPEAWRSAQRMIESSRTRLAPVYEPLAAQIADDFDLADREGIGIDLGSGPGDLILQLAPRTSMHWINADISPYFFSYFFRMADAAGISHRVSAIYADACDMPFRDNYADAIVSRGSYQFWPDLEKGLSEVYRVLKPGGVAYIGRGFAREFPLEVAEKVRTGQKLPNYDPAEHAARFRTLMAKLGIERFRVETPAPPGDTDIHYGVWVEFQKPN